jgi:hypothetical protein
MSESKFTPGPWEAVPEGHRLSVWAKGYGFVHTTEVPEVNFRATETANANARLIAAAPELLAALQALTDSEGHIWHGNSKECTGECKEVRAAIAKAEGAA